MLRGSGPADVIAQHYLDALDAVADDPDAGRIRGQAIAALTRAADRALRTGALARAAASYAAAGLTQDDTADGQQTAAASCGSTPPRPPSPMPTGPRRPSRPARPRMRTGSAAMRARPPAPR